MSGQANKAKRSAMFWAAVGVALFVVVLATAYFSYHPLKINVLPLP